MSSKPFSDRIFYSDVVRPRIVKAHAKRLANEKVGRGRVIGTLANKRCRADFAAVVRDNHGKQIIGAEITGDTDILDISMVIRELTYGIARC